MRKLSIVVVVAFAVSGCASGKSYSEKSVTKMQPGYGVMVATFTYVPGASKFPKAQLLSDAKLTCDGLESLKYQPFIVYKGANTVRVGIRASSHALALAYKKEFDRKGSLYLGNDVSLPLANVEIANIAELKAGALDEIP